MSLPEISMDEKHRVFVESVVVSRAFKDLLEEIAGSSREELLKLKTAINNSSTGQAFQVATGIRINKNLLSVVEGYVNMALGKPALLPVLLKTIPLFEHINESIPEKRKKPAVIPSRCSECGNLLDPGYIDSNQPFVAGYMFLDCNSCQENRLVYTLQAPFGATDKERKSLLEAEAQELSERIKESTPHRLK